MTTLCRYEKGPCTFPTMRRHFRCQDGSCPEQSGRLCSHEDPPAPKKSTLVYVAHAPEPQGKTKRQINETKRPAPTSAREEGETMAQGVKGTTNPVGSCDRCGKDVKLCTSKHAPGMRLCVSCQVRAFKRSKQGLPLDQAGGSKAPASLAKATKAAKAPTEPRPEAKTQQRPKEAATGQLVPLTARNLAEALQSEEVCLLVTCRTAAVVLAVVRAVESDADVMVALVAAV